MPPKDKIGGVTFGNPRDLLAEQAAEMTLLNGGAGDRFGSAIDQHYLLNPEQSGMPPSTGNALSDAVVQTGVTWKLAAYQDDQKRVAQATADYIKNGGKLGGGLDPRLLYSIATDERFSYVFDQPGLERVNRALHVFRQLRDANAAAWSIYADPGERRDAVQRAQERYYGGSGLSMQKEAELRRAGFQRIAGDRFLDPRGREVVRPVLNNWVTVFPVEEKLLKMEEEALAAFEKEAEIKRKKRDDRGWWGDFAAAASADPEAVGTGDMRALAEEANPEYKRMMQSLGLSNTAILNEAPLSEAGRHRVESAALLQQYIARVKGWRRMPEDLTYTQKAELLAEASKYFKRDVTDADWSLLFRSGAQDFYDVMKSFSDFYGLGSLTLATIEAAQRRDIETRKAAGSLTWAEERSYQDRRLKAMILGNIEKTGTQTVLEDLAGTVRWAVELGTTAGFASGGAKGITGFFKALPSMLSSRAAARSIAADIMKNAAAQEVKRSAFRTGLVAFGKAAGNMALEEAVRLPFYTPRIAANTMADMNPERMKFLEDGSLGVVVDDQMALNVGDALVKRAVLQYISQISERSGAVFGYVPGFRWLARLNSLSPEAKSRIGRGFMAWAFGSMPAGKAKNFMAVLGRTFKAANFHGLPGELFEEWMEKWFNYGATRVGEALDIRGLAAIGEDSPWMSREEMIQTLWVLGLTQGVMGASSALGNFQSIRRTTRDIEGLKAAGDELWRGGKPNSKVLTKEVLDLADDTIVHLPADALHVYLQQRPELYDQLHMDQAQKDELAERAADNGIVSIPGNEIITSIEDKVARDAILDMAVDGESGVGIIRITPDILRDMVIHTDPKDKEAAAVAFQRAREELDKELEYRAEVAQLFGVDAEGRVVDTPNGVVLNFRVLDAQLDAAGRHSSAERWAAIRLMMRLVDNLVSAEAKKFGISKREALQKILQGHQPTIKGTRLADFERMLVERLRGAQVRTSRSQGGEEQNPTTIEENAAAPATVAESPAPVGEDAAPAVDPVEALNAMDPAELEKRMKVIGGRDEMGGLTGRIADFIQERKDSGVALDDQVLYDAALQALGRAYASFDPAKGDFENFANRAITNAFEDVFRRAGGEVSTGTQATSIDENVGEDDDVSLGEVIPDAKARSGEDVAQTNDVMTAIDAAAAVLTDAERAVFLAIKEGKTQTEIAKERGISVQAVSAAWARAQEKLQVELAKRGIGLQSDMGNKKAGELLPFRDLARGLRFDNTSIAAVRRSIENIASLDPAVKSEFLKFFDLWASGETIPGGDRAIDARGFASALTSLLGFHRDGSSSTYRTVGGNTVRVAYHSASMRTFREDGRQQENIVSISIEKPNQRKKFQGDSSVNGVEYVFPMAEITHGQLGVIIHDIAQFFATGEYFDHAGAKYAHVSGSEEFKKSAQEKIDANAAERERLYNEAGVSMQMTPDSTFGAFDKLTQTIHLFEKANASTFPHESMHWFLDLLKDLDGRGMLEGTRYAEDLRKLTEYATDKDGEYDEEKLTRTWEYYLREGKAPEGSGLEEAFRVLKNLLKTVYKSIGQILGKDFSLDPDVQGIFDNWLASDYQAEQELGGNPLLQLLLQYHALEGMGNVDRAMLQKIGQQLLDATAEELDKLKTKGYREAHRAARADAEAEADTIRAYKAALIAAKLGGVDAASVANYGEDVAKILKRQGISTRENDGKGEAPVALAQVADEAGYNSVEEMLQDLRESKTRIEFVRAKVQATMNEWQEAYPASDAAINAEETMKQVENLLASLREKVDKDQAPVNRAAFRLAAVERLSGMTVDKAMRIDVTRNAIKRNARDAIRFLQNGKYDEAIKAVGNVYTLTALAREQQNFRDELDKTRRFAARLRRMKNVEGTLLIHARKIADAYGLSDDPIARVAAPAAPLEQAMRVAGMDIADAVLPEARAHQALTVEEFNQVRAMLNSIVAVGRNFVAEGKKNWRAGRDAEAAAIMGQNVPEAPDTAADADSKTKALSLWLRWRAINRTLFNFAQKLDGGKNIQRRGKEGAAEKYIYDPYMRAAEKEYLIKKRAVAMAEAPLRYLMQRVKSIDLANADLPAPNAERARAVNRRWSAENVIAIILNSGNEDNLKKLAAGEGWADGDIDRFRKLLDRKEDWDAIQTLWDALDTLFEDVDRAFYRANYRHLTKVEATSFDVTLANGETMTVRGGYMPLSYDGRLSFGPGAMDSFGNLNGGRETNGYAVGGSMTHERMDNVQKVVDLSLAGFARHIDEAAHYAAYKDLSRKMSYLMSRGDFQRYLDHKLGSEYKSFEQALKEGITQEPFRLHPVMEFLRRCAINIGLWGNLHVWVQQFSTARVGAHMAGEQYYWAALTRFGSNPKKWIKWVNEISPSMAERFEAKDADIRNKLHDMLAPEWKRKLDWVVAAGFEPIRWCDAAAVYPVFMAMHDRMLAEGKTRMEAAEAAYKLIASTQGTGRSIDQSGAQHTKLGRAFLMFAGPTVALHNHVMDVFANRKQFDSPLNFGMALFDSVVFPVLTNVLIDTFFYGTIKQLGSDDPKEREKALRKIIGSFGAEGVAAFIGGTPIRELSAVAGYIAEGKRRNNSFFRTPVSRVPDLGLDTLLSMSRGKWDQAAWNGAEALTGLTGVPLGTVAKRFYNFGKDYGLIEEEKPKRQRNPKGRK